MNAHESENYHAYPLHQNSVDIFWAESSPRVPDYCATLRSRIPQITRRRDLAAAILYVCLQEVVLVNERFLGHQYIYLFSIFLTKTSMQKQLLL